MGAEPNMEEAALDDIIDRLLDVRNGRPGKQVRDSTLRFLTAFSTPVCTSCSPQVVLARRVLLQFVKHIIVTNVRS